MYNQITIPNPNPTLEQHQCQLQTLSMQPLRLFTTPAETEEELAQRCQGADVILVGWDTKIPKNVILQCPTLRHIALACTLFPGPHSNVDLITAKRQNIQVSGVRDYGDRGVAEWVVAQSILHLQKGLPPKELQGTSVGIIGAGGAGAPTALAFQALGANVQYFSRRPKVTMQQANIPRKTLEELLQESQILSIHLPRNTQLGGKENFESFQGNFIINTSLGLPFNPEDFLAWLNHSAHFAAMDKGGCGGDSRLENHPHMTHIPHHCGFTKEAQDRLIHQVILNLKNGL
ncbi:MAG: hypothetical protein MI717_07965 [Spirochaetales bacterium]|nr:hypothetical protein [Spirochaetales bacterium]